MTQHEIIKKNEKYIKKIVYEYYNKYSYFGIEYDDLYQTAMLEVLKKIDKYDSKRGAFTTYITFVVKSALTIYIDSNIAINHIPYELIENSKRLFLKQEEFYLKTGKKMTYEEMIECMEEYNRNSTTTSYIDRLLYINNCCFVDKVKNIDEEIDIDEEDIITLKDIISSGEDIEDEIVSKILVETLLEYIKKIEPINYELFIEKYGIYDGKEKNFREMGEERNVSFQCIEQKIKKMKELFEARKGTIKKLIK